MRSTGCRARPHRRFELLLLLLPLLLLAACDGGSGTANATKASPTPTATPLPPVTKGVYLLAYDQTMANGQQSAINETIVALNPADGSVRWKALTSKNTNLVATDRIVYASDAQGVEALRASDGSRIWSHPGATSFLYGNGVVYAMSCSGTPNSTCALSALDGLTGATHWTSNVQGGNIALAGSDILVSSETITSQSVPDAASLSVVNASTGKLLWTTAVKDKGFNVVASYGDQLYLLRESDTIPVTNQIQAVRLSDGSQLWESGVIQQYSITLGADSAHLYIETTNGMLALNAADGSVAWTYTAGLVAESVLANGVVYMPLYTGTLVAVDAKSGQALSSTPFNYAQISSPVVANGLIYLNSVSADGSHTATYSALNTTAHFALQWSYPGTFDRPTVASGTLFTTNYAPTTTPSVYAFNATSGALLWKYDVGHMVAYSATATTLTVVD